MRTILLSFRIYPCGSDQLPSPPSTSPPAGDYSAHLLSEDFDPSQGWLSFSIRRFRLSSYGLGLHLQPLQPK
jgi:hypothetical protein